MEFQTGFLQLFLYGAYEGLNVLVAGGLGSVQFVLDVVVDIVLGVLQREVFQLRLQLVESQFVGQWGIEVGGLVGHLAPCLVVGGILYLPHDVDAVGYHNEYDAHVLGEREQEVAEILRLDGGASVIQLIDAYQSADDACHVFAVFFFDLFGGVGAAAYGVAQHHPQYGSTPHSNLFGHDDSRLHILDKGIQPEYVAVYTVALYGVYKVRFQLAAIAFQERIARESQ